MEEEGGIRDTRGRNAERLVWRWAVGWGWGAWRRRWGIRDTRGRNAERLVWRWAVGWGWGAFWSLYGLVLGGCRISDTRGRGCRVAFWSLYGFVLSGCRVRWGAWRSEGANLSLFTALYCSETAVEVGGGVGVGGMEEEGGIRDTRGRNAERLVWRWRWGGGGGHGGGGGESETPGVGMQRDWCGGWRWGGGGGHGGGGGEIRDTRGRNAERLVWRWAVGWGGGAWRKGGESETPGAGMQRDWCGGGAVGWGGGGGGGNQRHQGLECRKTGVVISGRKRDTRGTIGMQRLVWWCGCVECGGAGGAAWRRRKRRWGEGGQAVTGVRKDRETGRWPTKKKAPETKPAGGAED